jgi:hypothetical protein
MRHRQRRRVLRVEPRGAGSKRGRSLTPKTRGRPRWSISPSSPRPSRRRRTELSFGNPVPIALPVRPDLQLRWRSGCEPPVSTVAVTPSFGPFPKFPGRS